MNECEVAVGIITYRHEKYIRQCLDSVFNQVTNFDYKVIVAEDASPDSTRKILLEYKEKYGKKLVLILHDNNVGPSANAKSMRPYYADCKYIALVEGDDFWNDKYKLQKQYDILSSHPQYSAVCCDYKTVNCDGVIIRDSNLKCKYDFTKSMKDWINEPYTLHTCTIFRRNIFPVNEKKYIDLTNATPTMGDLISFTLLYDYGKIYVIKEAMASHRIASEKDISSFSMRSKNNPLKYTEMYLKIFSNLENYFDGKYDFSKRKALKLSATKYRKLVGEFTYSSNDMRKLEQQVSKRWRIYIYIDLVKNILMTIKRKVIRGVKPNGQ